MATVRVRLTVVAALVSALVLTATAVVLVRNQRAVLTTAVDESLRQRAVNLLPQLNGRTALVDEGDREDSFVQLINASGVVARSTPNVAKLPAVLPGLASRANDVIATASRFMASEHEFRVLRRSVQSRDGVVTLVVAKNLDDVNDSVRVLRRSLWIAIPLVLLLFVVLMYWLTGRVLRPVDAIRSEVATIEATALHRRVPVAPGDNEFSRLARTMNAMLDRVEDGAQRQSRFVGDASHELRSPLTRIRSQLELALAYPDRDVADETYVSLLQDAADLQRLIDDLLVLASTDRASSAFVPVDLDDLALVHANSLRVRSALEVDTTHVGAARVLGDADQLSRAIRNVVDNAERHARSRIVVDVREQNGFAVVSIADDGLGIPSEQHSVVFERFTRLDEARTRDNATSEGGSGLGLAIVREIVERHGGTVRIASRDDEGAKLVISIPRAD